MTRSFALDLLVRTAFAVWMWMNAWAHLVEHIRNAQTLQAVSLALATATLQAHHQQILAHQRARRSLAPLGSLVLFQSLVAVDPRVVLVRCAVQTSTSAQPTPTLAQHTLLVPTRRAASHALVTLAMLVFLLARPLLHALPLVAHSAVDQALFLCRPQSSAQERFALRLSVAVLSLPPPHNLPLLQHQPRSQPLRFLLQQTPHQPPHQPRTLTIHVSCGWITSVLQ